MVHYRYRGRQREREKKKVFITRTPEESPGWEHLGLGLEREFLQEEEFPTHHWAIGCLIATVWI